MGINVHKLTKYRAAYILVYLIKQLCHACACLCLCLKKTHFLTYESSWRQNDFIQEVPHLNCMDIILPRNVISFWVVFPFIPLSIKGMSSLRWSPFCKFFPDVIFRSEMNTHITIWWSCKKMPLPRIWANILNKTAGDVILNLPL